jgi:hypothetical protein
MLEAFKAHIFVFWIVFCVYTPKALIVQSLVFLIVFCIYKLEAFKAHILVFRVVFCIYTPEAFKARSFFGLPSVLFILSLILSLDASDIHAALKYAKAGRTVMMFVKIAGNPSRDGDCCQLAKMRAV